MFIRMIMGYRDDMGELYNAWCIPFTKKIEVDIKNNNKVLTFQITGNFTNSF